MTSLSSSCSGGGPECDTVAQGYLTSQAWSFLFVCGEITSVLTESERSVLIALCRFEEEEPQINHQTTEMARLFERRLSFDRLEEVFHLD
jgi:hypothetical protein